MNKRARQRLIGVTALLVLAIAAIVFTTTSGGEGAGAYYRTVEEILAGTDNAGEKVKVGGTVVPGSWDLKTRPMEFDIRPEDDKDGPTIHVIYNGTVPTTFGDLSTAIITGVYDGEGTIESSTMLVQCPSKYESAEGAISVSEALDKAGKINFAVITGVVKAGSIGGEGFELSDAESPSKTLRVKLDTALPENVKDGTSVVVEGSFDGDVFVAKMVAEAKEE